MKMEEGER